MPMFVSVLVSICVFVWHTIHSAHMRLTFPMVANRTAPELTQKMHLNINKENEPNENQSIYKISTATKIDRFSKYFCTEYDNKKL